MQIDIDHKAIEQVAFDKYVNDTSAFGQTMMLAYSQAISIKRIADRLTDIVNMKFSEGDNGK